MPRLSEGNKCQLSDIGQYWYWSLIWWTCFKNNHKSVIDLILTDIPNSFQNSSNIETGASEYHKLVVTFFKIHFNRLSPKTVYYRKYKNFDQDSFPNDLQRTNFELESNNTDENYRFITETFTEIVARHIPLKKKFILGNQAPFINKKLRKAIWNKSRLRNFFCKHPIRLNKVN